MFLIFVPLIIIAVIAFITFGINNGKIAVGTCECGGKYKYLFYDGKWDKNVYKCDKCKKTIM